MTNILLAVFLLLAPLLTGCAVNPVSGKQDIVLMSEEQELALGRKTNQQVLQQYGVYDDQELNAYVKNIGEKLAAQSHRRDLVYRFTVVDSKEVNAFALPGGYIYITRGLLAYLNSEAELAAVPGAERGHVTARHSVRQISMARAASLGYTIGAILVPEAGSPVGQNLFDILGGALVSGYGRD